MVNFKSSEFRKGFYIFTKPHYFPVYLIVINDLDVIKANYPLLLLGNAYKQEELWIQLIGDIKKEINAKNIEKLWKYMIFSIKRNIFKIKEGELMKKVKELSEYNESINNLFDDEFLGKILDKKDDEFLGKILRNKDDEILGKLVKERGNKFISKILKEQGKDFLVSILAELGEEEVTGILEKIRKSKKKKIKEELEK